MKQYQLNIYQPNSAPPPPAVLEPLQRVEDARRAYDYPKRTL